MLLRPECRSLFAFRTVKSPFRASWTWKRARKLKSKLKGWMIRKKRTKERAKKCCSRENWNVISDFVPRSVRLIRKKCTCFPVGDVWDRRRERYKRVYVLSRVRNNRVSLYLEVTMIRQADLFFTDLSFSFLLSSSVFPRVEVGCRVEARTVDGAELRHINTSFFSMVDPPSSDAAAKKDFRAVTRNQSIATGLNQLPAVLPERDNEVSACKKPCWWFGQVSETPGLCLARQVGATGWSPGLFLLIFLWHTCSVACVSTFFFLAVVGLVYWPMFSGSCRRQIDFCSRHSQLTSNFTPRLY